jgi:hypothetical protein
VTAWGSMLLLRETWQVHRQRTLTARVRHATITHAPMAWLQRGEIETAWRAACLVAVAHENERLNHRPAQRGVQQACLGFKQ